MTLYDVSLSYVHIVCLNEYMMKVLLNIIKVSYTAFLMYEVNGMIMVSL